MPPPFTAAPDDDGAPPPDPDVVPAEDPQPEEAAKAQLPADTPFRTPEARHSAPVQGPAASERVVRGTGVFPQPKRPEM
jgi:hypothetical protein